MANANDDGDIVVVKFAPADIARGNGERPERARGALPVLSLSVSLYLSSLFVSVDIT